MEVETNNEEIHRLCALATELERAGDEEVERVAYSILDDPNFHELISEVSIHPEERLRQENQEIRATLRLSTLLVARSDGCCLA